jgi:hypothetical protein
MIDKAYIQFRFGKIKTRKETRTNGEKNRK